MQEWEYKVIDWWPTESELNKLGADGWELVTVAVSSNEFGTDTVKAYLKRPISN